jgi:predicted RNA methylase
MSMPATLKFVNRPRESRQATDRNGDSEANTLGQYIPLIYHYNMLQDEDRVGAFRQAIELTVKPGMRVVELGGGTGILSALAARRGAQVDCVERNPELAGKAERFIADNGLERHVRVVAGDAAEFVPTRPVDVVICEMLHVGLLREKQSQVITAFKKNYQRRFGDPLPTFIPEVSILMLQPVQQDFAFSGFVAPVPMFQAPTIDQPRTTIAADLIPYATIDYQHPIPLRHHIQQSFRITVASRINAIRLVTQNVLAIDIPNQHAVTWANQCLVLPLENTVECQPGETVNIAMHYQAGGAIEDVGLTLQHEREMSRADVG